MAGTTQATWRAALARAAFGALLTSGIAYATTITQVDDDCGAVTPVATKDCEPGTMTAQNKAFFPALAAGLTYLLARGGIEGATDAKRQKAGSVKDSDVQV